MSTPQKSNSSSSKQKKWRPDVSSEARKLGNNEDDWNLASAGNQLARRTRASTSSAPPIVRPLQLQQEPRQLFDLDDTRGDDNSTALSSLTDDNSALSRSRKPPHTRVIIEVNKVTTMLQKYLSCPKCKAALAVTFPTTCIASGCRLKCLNEMDCDFVVVQAPASSEVPLADDNRALITRSTDYALNVLYVIGFIASGCQTNSKD